MKPESLLNSLQSASMPLMLHNENGLASRVHESLWAYAKGSLSEEELEDFVARKMDEAALHQETLETMEYPDLAEDKHVDLHEAFQRFEAAFVQLEELLWGEGVEDQDEFVGQVLRSFLEADKLLARFGRELDEQIDGFAENEGPGLSLKG